MSKDLVKRWRRLSREWRETATDLAIRDVSVTEIADCRARADVYRQCADSLALSIRRAQRKEEHA